MRIPSGLLHDRRRTHAYACLLCSRHGSMIQVWAQDGRTHVKPSTCYSFMLYASSTHESEPLLAPLARVCCSVVSHAPNNALTCHTVTCFVHVWNQTCGDSFCARACCVVIFHAPLIHIFKPFRIRTSINLSDISNQLHSQSSTAPIRRSLQTSLSSTNQGQFSARKPQPLTRRIHRLSSQGKLETSDGCLTYPHP